MSHCNPFTDRLCRDIRNDLSEGLMKSLHTLDVGVAEKIAEKYLNENLQSVYREYIVGRMDSYRRVVESISRNRIKDAFQRALVLWDEKLFFEVHEILEQEWLKSSGKTKLILQAMIRAAGMYVQLDRDNLKGAASMAAKAVAAFEKNRDIVPDCLDLDSLLIGLRKVDPVPPKLLI